MASAAAAASALKRNGRYIKQQFIALLGNISFTVRCICVWTLVGYCVSFSEKAVNVLSVTPGYLLPPSFWIWTACTFCFIELHFWEVFIDLVTVGLCGKLIEPLWGQMEMLKFFAITNFGVAVITTVYYLFVYIITKNTELLFDVHIHGLAGYVAAVTVAVRQIMPNSIIAITPLGEFTNRNIPLSVVVVSLLFWFVGILDGTFPIMFISGILVSWVYLRFIQLHGNKRRGDSAENFSFDSFFPNVMQPVIKILLNPLYMCFFRVGFIRHNGVTHGSSMSLTSINVTMPSMDVHDVERRRAIALNALSDRLSKNAKSDHRNILPKSTTPVKNKQSDHTKHYNSHSNLMLEQQTIPFVSALSIKRNDLSNSQFVIAASNSSSLPVSNTEPYLQTQGEDLLHSSQLSAIVIEKETSDNVKDSKK